MLLGSGLDCYSYFIFIVHMYRTALTEHLLLIIVVVSSLKRLFLDNKSYTKPIPKFQFKLAFKSYNNFLVSKHMLEHFYKMHKIFLKAFVFFKSNKFVITLYQFKICCSTNIKKNNPVPNDVQVVYQLCH